MATVIDRYSQPVWRDFFEPTKPKVVALVLTTSLIGMLLATKAPLDGFVSWQILIFGNLGVGPRAGAATAVNHTMDRRVDSIMVRTHKWPLVEGWVSPDMMLGFVLPLALARMAVLLVFANPLVTWLTFVSLLSYTVLHADFLKCAIPQNTVTGGLAGVAPSLPGWVVIAGHLSAEPLLSVLTIFAWTPPHFRTLYIHRRDEYVKADAPTLPVIHSERYIRLHILLYTLVLLAVNLMLFVVHMGGLVYLFYALVLGAHFLDQAWALYRDSWPRTAVKTFKYPIVYSFLLFMALLVDHCLPLKLPL